MIDTVMGVLDKESREVIINHYLIPFYHMQHEPFWKLIRKVDAPASGRKFYASIKSLRMNFVYAEMDEELFELMMDVDAAGVIRQKLEEIIYRNV